MSEATEIWKQYKVALQFTNEVMGSTPKNPDLIGDWLAARRAPNPEANAEEIAAGIEPTEEKSWVGFQSKDNLGPCLRGYHVKAHIKDAARVLAGLLDERTLRSRLADRVYVIDDYIPLGTEVDGFEERAIHVMTRQGPRNALKRADFVRQPRIEFRLAVLADNVVDEGLLRSLFAYGGLHGLGGDRGLGFGRYELAELEEVC